MKLFKFVKSKTRLNENNHANIIDEEKDESVDEITENNLIERNHLGWTPSCDESAESICYHESIEVTLSDYERIWHEENLLRQNSPVEIDSHPRSLNLGSFKLNSDKFTYPSLFEEADDMINLSCMVYTLVELRMLARSDKLQESDNSLKVLKLPLSFDTALTILTAEAEILEEVLNDGKHDEALSAVHSLLNRRSEVTISRNTVDIFENGSNSLLDDSNLGISRDLQTDDKVPMLVAVGDTNVTKELVYAIGVNPLQKRITVAFRGSITRTDFLSNAMINLVKVPHPSDFSKGLENSSREGSLNDDSKDQIRIHQGFYEYLFGEDDNNNNKFTEIIDQVRSLFDADPNRRKEYKLYVTGHSLGGALATLFGFYATASSLPFPVTVVSIASPRVGNAEFARTFLELESRGKLRHLRIVNHMDPVTLIPRRSSTPTFNLSTQSFRHADRFITFKKYYHTGMKLKLFKEPKYSISYSGASNQLFLEDDNNDNSSDEGEDINEEWIDHDMNKLGNLVEEKRSDMKEVGNIPIQKRPSKPRLSFINVQNMPFISNHMGTAYSERLVSISSELSQLSLNHLYLERNGKIETV